MAGKPGWTVVATNLAGHGGVTNFTPAGALTNAAGFHRVRRQSTALRAYSTV